MSANTQGQNPFATNNSGGGVGTITAMPQTGTYQMAQQGQYPSFGTPNWITGGLQQSSQPIQNFPVQNYGRWNWNNGNFNGAGMAYPSAWPSASSITQPYGAPQNQTIPNAAQSGGAPFGTGGFGPAPNAQLQGVLGGLQGALGQGGTFGGNRNPYEGMTLAQKAAAGNVNAQQRLATHDPAQVQAAAQQLGQMSPAQQAQYLRANPNMERILTTMGLLGRNTVNNLFAGSETQSLSGQPLRPY